MNELEIQTLIENDKNSHLKKLAKMGQRYYEAEHDILRYKLFYFDSNNNLVEDTTRSNIKISHAFYTELVDQLASYILSFSENPIQAIDKTSDFQKHLDTYFDDEFWSEVREVITGANAKGFDYLYAYMGSDNRLHFQYADGLGVVEVRADETDSNCKCFIYWYIERIAKDNSTIKRIQVWTDKDITFYCQKGDGKIQLDSDVEINPRPHIVIDKEDGKYGKCLGFAPFWRLDNNKKQFSLLKNIKGIIDDYDLHSCALSNNLIDFDHPIYAVSGYNGTDLDTLIQNIKTKKTVGMDSSGSLDIKTIDIPYQARKEKLEMDKENIYRFGMGLNTQSLKDTSATTNIAIKMAYTLLDLKADKIESRLKVMLNQICKVVIDEINQKYNRSYSESDYTIKFTHEIIANETENINNEKTKADTLQVNINTLLNASGSIGDEQAIKKICDLLDIDYNDINQGETITSIADAQNILNNLGDEDND